MNKKQEKGKNNIERDKKQEMQIIRFLFAHRLLERFVLKKSTEKEKRLISSWQPSHQAGLFNMPEMDEEEAEARIYQKISRRIFSEQLDHEQSVAKEKNIKLHIFSKLSIAVSILLILGSGLYIANNNLGINRKNYINAESANQTVIQTKNGEKKHVALPDGTVIQLNSNTRLSYLSDEFNRKKREVILEEGEVFFDVARNEKKPFIIHSGGIATTVRGTSFNIKAYAMLENIVISVHTGIVDVATEKKTLERLTVNQQIIINKASEQFRSSKIDWHDAVGWIDNRLVLYDTGIDELKLSLEQQFNINIQIKENALKGVRFTASFEADANLKDVMEVLHALYGIDYMIIDKTIIIYK